MNCDARVLEGNDCSLNESLWLKCSNGEDGEEDEEENEEEDGEHEMDVKFGGAYRLNLTLGNFHRKCRL